jgi:hypothetical protein
MIDGLVTVAIHKDRSYEPVIVRSFREDGAPKAKTKKLHEIHHNNVLTLLESLTSSSSVFPSRSSSELGGLLYGI